MFTLFKHKREPRGFGFVKFRNSEDAAEAKHHLNDTVIGGRQIAIVFAAENRKTPQDMRRSGGGRLLQTAIVFSSFLQQLSYYVCSFPIFFLLMQWPSWGQQ